MSVLDVSAPVTDLSTANVRNYSYTPADGADRIVLAHIVMAEDFGGSLGLVAEQSITLDGDAMVLKGIKLGSGSSEYMHLIAAIAIDDSVSGSVPIVLTRNGSGLRCVGYQFATLDNTEQADADLAFQYGIDAAATSAARQVDVTPESVDDLVIALWGDLPPAGAFDPDDLVNIDGAAYGTITSNSSSGNNLRSRLLHGNYASMQSLMATARSLIGFVIRVGEPPVPDADPINVRELHDDEEAPTLFLGSRLHMRETVAAPERGAQRKPGFPDPIKPSNDRVK